MFSTPRSKRDANDDVSAEEEEEEDDYPDYEDDENTEEYELSSPYERVNAFNLIRFSLLFLKNRFTAKPILKQQIDEHPHRHHHGDDKVRTQSSNDLDENVFLA